MALIVAVAVLAVWMGLFRSIILQDSTFGPCTLVGLPHIGPYRGVGATFEKFCKAMETGQVPHSKWSIGIYYDNPQDTPPEKCRSLCCLAYKTLTENQKAELRDRSYVLLEIPSCRSKSWDFPVRNSLSYMFGALKFYGYINKHQFNNVSWGIEQCSTEETGTSVVTYIGLVDHGEVLMPNSDVFKTQ